MPPALSRELCRVRILGDGGGGGGGAPSPDLDTYGRSFCPTERSEACRSCTDHDQALSS